VVVVFMAAGSFRRCGRGLAAVMMAFWSGIISFPLVFLYCNSVEPNGFPSARRYPKPITGRHTSPECALCASRPRLHEGVSLSMSTAFAVPTTSLRKSPPCGITVDSTRRAKRCAVATYLWYSSLCYDRRSGVCQGATARVQHIEAIGCSLLSPL